MPDKSLYQYIFSLLDFAEIIAQKIAPDEPENNSYFMTLVYVEDILDKYGRGLILQSENDSEKARQLLQQANERLNILRKSIREFAQQYDFDETLKYRSERMYADWHKLPDNHPES